MLGFVVRRLLVSLLVMLVASMLVFTMVASLGDPLAELKNRQPPPPASVIQNRREELNLDKPIISRYFIWLGGFVRGDMGEDNRSREVYPRLKRALFITLRMVILATLLALALAVLVGVYSAVRQYSVGDYIATFTGFLFLSTPVFWLAALLKEYAAIRINNLFDTTLVYTVGAESPNLSGSFFERWADYLGHLALPTLALALISFAAWSRYQRATMLDVLNSDYVRLARAKGLSNRRVLVRHALRNALIPLTTVVAIDFAAVFGGAVITERVFAWQGMGTLLVEGVRLYDPNIVLAWLMVTGVIVILFNLLADILYGVLDPRIRFS
ncbi:MAG TPA: ABC transporter permease [Acidimicrobiales bacterium]|jgi:peptide/nickel transport system permease protein